MSVERTMNNRVNQSFDIYTRDEADSGDLIQHPHMTFINKNILAIIRLVVFGIYVLFICLYIFSSIFVVHLIYLKPSYFFIILETKKICEIFLLFSALSACRLELGTDETIMMLKKGSERSGNKVETCLSLHCREPTSNRGGDSAINPISGQVSGARAFKH
jgi:hypothetical protein